MRHRCANKPTETLEHGMATARATNTHTHTLSNTRATMPRYERTYTPPEMDKKCNGAMARPNMNTRVAGYVVTLHSTPPTDNTRVPLQPCPVRIRYTQMNCRPRPATDEPYVTQHETGDTLRNTHNNQTMPTPAHYGKFINPALPHVCGLT